MVNFFFIHYFLKSVIADLFLSYLPNLCLLRPYTPMHGALSHVWFDRYKISHDCPEHLESIEEMCSNLGAVVQDEIRAGVLKHRMIIGMALMLHFPSSSIAQSYILLHITCPK